MKIFELLSDIKKQNRLLYCMGVANMILFAACFIVYFFDSRLVMGINPWVKPMKFGLSVAIYCWTFGWLLQFLVSQFNIKLISWVVTICMIAENVIITIQAARGVTSHYNISSGLDAALFGTMGGFIGINTAAVFYTLVLFLFSEITLNKSMLLAWRLGLLVFLVGGISGGMMISNLAHTIGTADGSEGIAFLNWSKVAGDLRSAHFITLHGLQAIPLFAYFVSDQTKRPLLFTTLFFVLYALICIRLHQVASAGKPFFDFF
ncbi:MAG: hypothetical protein ACOVMQ_01160 [Cyclobacteriaceae bacterium]|jgi:hypothetical protein